MVCGDFIIHSAVYSSFPEKDTYSILLLNGSVIDRQETTAVDGRKPSQAKQNPIFYCTYIMLAVGNKQRMQRDWTHYLVSDNKCKSYGYTYGQASNPTGYQPVCTTVVYTAQTFYEYDYYSGRILQLVVDVSVWIGFAVLYSCCK